MENLQMNLTTVLKAKNIKCSERENTVSFKLDEGIFKAFFHKDSLDLVLTYKSNVTESGTRNLVSKNIKNTDDLHRVIDDVVNGVELSNSFLHSNGDIKESLSFDTYNRYMAMRGLIEVADELAF